MGFEIQQQGIYKPSEVWRGTDFFFTVEKRSNNNAGSLDRVGAFGGDRCSLNEGNNYKTSTVL